MKRLDGFEPPMSILSEKVSSYPLLFIPGYLGNGVTNSIFYTLSTGPQNHGGQSH